MPISDQFARLPIADIVVDRPGRQRREIKTADLEQSIARNGQLHPIIVTRELKLVTGERRLTACRNLGHADITVRFSDDLSLQELAIIELEENIKRQDLNWQEIAEGVCRIHQLFLTLDPDWTQGETADAIGIGNSAVSIYLRIGPMVGSDERISGAGTVQEAYNVVKRRDQRLMGVALEELLEDTGPALAAAVNGGAGPDTPTGVVVPIGAAGGIYNPPSIRLVVSPPVLPPAPARIEQKSFLEWAPTYDGKKFNLVHCDFPYGIDVFAGKQASRTDDYIDTRDVYVELLECFCAHIDKFMSTSAHLVFWYGGKNRDLTLDMFRRLAPSVEFWHHSLIWTKSDGAGVMSRAEKYPRHVHETALFGWRGVRNIVKVKGDSYASPSDRALHPSAKPEPMLRHFIEMLVDETTVMLDPTCGSGSSVRASEALGASFSLGLEIDPTFAADAQRALEQARRMRTVER